MINHKQKQLINDAKMVATVAHHGQIRRYGGLPYITHPKAVATIVEENDGTAEMIAAAWLHDVVEDTDITFGKVYEYFPDEVAHLVFWLTDPSKEVGNRAVRKAMTIERLSRAPQEARAIKLADIIHNASTMDAASDAKKKLFFEEKKALAQVLYMSEYQYLTSMAWEIFN